MPETFLNVGIWAIGPTHAEDHVKANRQLERKVQELGGRKWLYAQTYYSEGQFWDIYDRDAYETLRNEYHATHLPSVFDKVKFVRGTNAQELRVARFWSFIWSIWPLRGLYGLFHAMFGLDYLLSPNSWLLTRSTNNGTVKGTRRLG